MASTLFFATRLLIDLEPMSPGSLTRKPWQSSQLCLPRAGTTSICHHALFFFSLRELRHQTEILMCEASSLPAGPSLKLSSVIFKKYFVARIDFISVLVMKKLAVGFGIWTWCEPAMNLGKLLASLCNPGRATRTRTSRAMYLLPPLLLLFSLCVTRDPHCRVA